MFESLERVFVRPAPFAVNTTEALWTDPHISERMLDLHLDETAELASRPKAFIEASAAWIAARFRLGPGRRLCDLGCGPGLYTTRFARTGAAVVGIDFSARSIAHARWMAADQGLCVDHVLGDYLTADIAGPFDLVTLIFFDFCALGPTRRRALLAHVRPMLADGGEILLDVVSRAYLAGVAEGRAIDHHPNGGFWAAGPHHVLRCAFKYEPEGVFLEKYAIVEPHRIREIYNWVACLDLADLRAEFARAGFTVTESWGNVAGAPYEEGATEYAVVARKAA